MAGTDEPTQERPQRIHAQLRRMTATGLLFTKDNWQIKRVHHPRIPT